MKRIVLILFVAISVGCDALTGSSYNGPTISLKYQVQGLDEGEHVLLSRLIEAVQCRIDCAGIRSVKVKEYSPNQIAILVPVGQPQVVKRIERLMSLSGTLEFRILADDRDRRHQQAIAMAQKTDGATVMSSDRSEVLGWWVPVSSGNEDDFTCDPNLITRTSSHGDNQVIEVLVVSDPYNVTGEYLSRCNADIEAETGRPCVMFNFNSTGGRLFGEFTRVNKPKQEDGQELHRKLGIILDGKIYSAPVILETIRDRGRITGDFTQEEVDDLVAVLNSGSLPMQIKRIESKSK